MTLLTFTNRFTSELPGDRETKSYSHQVMNACWSAVNPTPVHQAKLIAYSAEVAQMLGLSDQTMRSETLLQILAGNKQQPNMKPYATCYGGHQFGHWAGQLGDGRVIFLGEIKNQAGHYYELQLKGAGPTPYSRNSDGRAVLRSSLREFLCSEAMHHLGIPTTRALSLVSTGDAVMRDMFYDGNPVAEPGAIVCRVAPSFLRFGHFEIFAVRGEQKLLSQLIEFTLAHYFPHYSIAEFFVEVCRRTAYLIAQWIRVGFVHGVMNTDNMSILGLTIDYGPYGWIDNFDLNWTPNTTDAKTHRYCFGRQMEIARWNVQQLGSTLMTLSFNQKDLEAGLAEFDITYQQELEKVLLGKFGLLQWQENDSVLLNEIFQLMQQAEIDMTDFFRCLAKIDVDSPNSEILTSAFYDEALKQQFLSPINAWLISYADRLKQDSELTEQRITRMNQFNPRFVLRNYLAQQAIDLAEQGDYQMLNDLLETLRKPYDEQPERKAFSEKRPEWAKHKAGCSMLSCSS